MEQKSDLEKKLYGFFWILVVGMVLANIKSIFTDFDVDSEYAMVMSYRMVRGEHLITQMWEPHQTSGFLAAIFIKIYLSIFKTTTGMVIYLHVVGVLLKTVFAYGLYRALKLYLNKVQLFFICIFFLSVFPKGLPMPEFSNMAVWFSTALFCCLIRFFQNQTGLLWLTAAGVFLSLLVLSYPSCVLVFFGVVILLFLYTEHPWKNMLILSGTCLALGGIFVGWILSYTSLAKLWENVGYILTGDSSHEQGLLSKLMAYGLDFAELLLKLLIVALLALLVVIIGIVVHKLQHRDFTQSDKFKWWGVSFWSILLIRNLLDAIFAYERYEHLIIYIPILFFALRSAKLCNKVEKQILYTGLTIGILGFVAALILSNLPLTASMGYLVLAICVSIVPIVHRIEVSFNKCKLYTRYFLLWAFCLITIFRTGFVIKPVNLYLDSVLGIRGIVKSGPAMGIMSEYMGPYIMNSGMEEWKTYVKPGDAVLLVGNGAVSTIGYMYEDTEISAASTISTPTYDEALLYYWEQNPEKYPDVVIVDCWYGELKMEEDSWIMKWIQNDFQPSSYVDGMFRRYYRLDEEKGK